MQLYRAFWIYIFYSSQTKLLLGKKRLRIILAVFETSICWATQN